MNYTKSSHVEALSIHHQQSQQKRGDSRKHILALLSSFTREEAEVQREETEQLCCFDRMKKLIGHRDSTDEQASKDQTSAIVIEQKINRMEGRLSKQTAPKPSHIRPHQRASSSSNFHRQSFMIESIKKDCLHKYLSHQVGKRDKDIDDARKMIDREIKAQVDDLIDDKGLQLMKMRENNEVLTKQILNLDLEIEGLRARETQMREYIAELEEVSKGKKDSKKSQVPAVGFQTFEERFRDVFGECSIEDLKRRLDVSIEKCLQGFEKAENKNQAIIQDQKKAFESSNDRMQKRINHLQSNENELLGNLRTLKLNKQLSDVEAEELVRGKVELESLHKLILALFTEWHSNRGEGEKRLLKIQGCLSENYSYEEMVRYIVQHNGKYSTDQKLNDYLFKILRGIQKLRRTINPEQCNEKLDPLAALERIEKWVKMRVAMPALSKKPTISENCAYLGSADD